MAKIVKLSDFDQALELCMDAISQGQIVIYPTDTLYGIGCDATNKEAVEKIYAAKSREKGKPVSVLFANLNMMKDYCKISAKEEKILVAHLPGPYTFILQLAKPLPCSETLSIGCRVPNHAFMRTASKICNIPIVTTSANISGDAPPHKFSQIAPGLLEKCAVAVDGGDCVHASGSTVVDLASGKVLRQGAGAWKA